MKGHPIVGSWISTDGHYGFLEFRTAEEAQLGFNLHGMTLQGSEIKIGRPKAFQDAEGEMPAQLTLEDINPLIASSHNQSAGAQQFPVFVPTRILKITNIASFDTTARFEACRLLRYDIKQKCAQFGKVLSIKIPRPIWTGIKAEVSTPEEEPKPAKGKKKDKPLEDVDNKLYYTFPEAFGCAFIEFESEEQALETRRNINLCRYNNKTIECSFWDEDMYHDDQF